MVYTDGVTLEILDEKASKALDKTAKEYAEQMEELYDAANLARRAKSRKNRKRTSSEVIPEIDVGDYECRMSYTRSTKSKASWITRGWVHVRSQK